MNPLGLSTGDMTHQVKGVDEAHDITYELVACNLHGGRDVVDTRTAIDEASTATVELPIYSDNVGYQEDCVDCENQAILTWEHHRQCEVHDEIALVRYGRAERYGISPERAGRR